MGWLVLILVLVIVFQWLLMRMDHRDHCQQVAKHYRAMQAWMERALKAECGGLGQEDGYVQGTDRRH